MSIRLSVATLALLLVVFPLFSFAQTPAELEQQITDYNKQLEALDKEIAQYEAQLATTTTKKQSLQNTLDQLNIQRRKITTTIDATRKRISATELEIKQLTNGIQTKESTIDTHEEALKESLRRLNQMDDSSFVVNVLTAGDISSVWQGVDDLNTLQSSVQDDIDVLSTEKKSLAEIRSSQEAKRSQLRAQQSKLVAEQGSLDATRKTQNELLSETKAQESSYQALIREKQAAKAAFENALQDLQAKLQYDVDLSEITPAGKGVLSWPIDTVRVTQQFGNTAFALAGAYNGKGHNGIDLAASVGTPIRAALTGTVRATGDTGSVKGCYSYGRWVLIRHANGLDTLYAHLSQISVAAGEAVATGKIIGYAGQTGYATGPHLHFGVYVSSATQVIKLGEATNRTTPCSNALMPVAPLSGYLDPMSYL